MQFVVLWYKGIGPYDCNGKKGPEIMKSFRVQLSFTLDYYLIPILIVAINISK